jgi:hypothetical protein
MAIFCFGVALNDFLDQEKDARLAPERPIPSGSLSPAAALSASMAAAALALVLGALCGTRTFIALAVVLLLAASYDLLSRKSDLAGVLNLGCIRAADFYVGVTFVEPGQFSWWSWEDNTGLSPGIMMILYGAYATLLSIVALGERSQRKMDIRIPAAAAALVPVVPLIKAWTLGTGFAAVILWLVLALPVYRFFSSSSKRIEELVGHFVSGYFLVAASFAMAAERPWFCGGLWIAYFLSRWLSRGFPPS